MTPTSGESYHDIDGRPTSLERLVRVEPEWAVSRIRALESERDDLQSKLNDLQGKLDKVTDGLAEHLDLEFGAEIERLRRELQRERSR